jgi:serine/threonine-protein kinase RsbW
MNERPVRQHELDIPSKQNQLKKVVDFVEGLAQRAGFSEDAIVDIAISVSEAVNNAILHGNKKNPGKKVSVLAETTPNSLVLRVRDEGRSFTPTNISDPRTPDNLMKCNGRGILIQRALMDEVNFRTAPGGGTEVELVKKLPRRGTQNGKWRPGKNSSGRNTKSCA